MSKHISKLLCLVICIIFILPYEAFATTLSEVEEEQIELQSEISEIENRLTELEDNENLLEDYQKLLQEKVNLLQNCIENSESYIDIFSASISELELNIQTTTDEYEDVISMVDDMTKSLYLYKYSNIIEYMFNATSFYELSLLSVAIQAVSEYDSELLNQLYTYIELVEDDIAELDVQTDELELAQEQLAVYSIAYDEAYAENETLISTLYGTEEVSILSEYIEQLVSQQEADEQLAIIKAEAEVAAIAAAEEEARLLAEAEEAARLEAEALANAFTDDSPGSDLVAVWPVPGYTTITYAFGSGHYGIDISASYGAPVVSVQSGTVVSAEYHWSWGYNVFIEHNSTYSTRYAHLSSMAVSAGDTVEAGQVIGYIGNTGYSFGCHLHFEVYKNGTRVNPSSYLF